jgi:Asp/Glu/hydantoin racemase
MPRIKIIVPFPLKPDELKRREKSIPPGTLHPGVHVKFVSVKNGEYLDSYYTDLIGEFFVLEEGLKSEEEGYDAVCIDSMSDSALNALRSRLKIPVMSLFIVNAHVACILGHKFSVVSAWKRWLHLYKKNLIQYGLEHQCASLRAINIQPGFGATPAAKRRETERALEAECKAAVDQDGADVIILGSATMHEYWSYLAKQSTVPILSPAITSTKFAEMCIELGLAHSKKAFPSPIRLHDDWISKMASQASTDR